MNMLITIIAHLCFAMGVIGYAINKPTIDCIYIIVVGIFILVAGIYFK